MAIPSWVNSVVLHQYLNDLHPAVMSAGNLSGAYWPTILKQNPIVSTDNRIAYFQNSEKKARNLRTVTATGKYIKRHFPKLSDHIIRDIVSNFDNKAIILSDMESMIHAVINGPYSCMAGNKFDDKYHPYRVYDPVYGWKMAIRKIGTKIVARAVLHNNTFVRCFATSGDNTDYASGADSTLEACLIAMGYIKLSGYALGAKLARIEKYGEIVGPYMDGCNDTANDMGDYLKLCSNGDLELNNTTGLATNNDGDYCNCSDCGARIAYDDGHSINDDGDQVCDGCIDDYHYVSETRVNGRYIGGYYVPMHETTITVEGDRYPDNNLSDFDIVELSDGRHTHIDNCVRCEVTDDYYHCDDIGTDIFYCEDDTEYRSIDYWTCEETKKHYSNNIDYVTLSDGRFVHPDVIADKDTLELF